MQNAMILNDPAKLATPRQYRFIKALATERVVPEQYAGRLAQLVSNHEIGVKHLERKLASDTIAWLLKRPVAPVKKTRCIRCHRLLKTDASKAAGIGPICAGKHS